MGDRNPDTVNMLTPLSLFYWHAYHILSGGCSGLRVPGNGQVAMAAESAAEMAEEDGQAAAELSGAGDPVVVAARTSRDLGISLYTLGAILIELQRLTPAEAALRESVQVLLKADGASPHPPPPRPVLPSYTTVGSADAATKRAALPPRHYLCRPTTI